MLCATITHPGLSKNFDEGGVAIGPVHSYKNFTRCTNFGISDIQTHFRTGRGWNTDGNEEGSEEVFEEGRQVQEEVSLLGRRWPRRLPTFCFSNRSVVLLIDLRNGFVPSEDHWSCPHASSFTRPWDKNLSWPTIKGHKKGEVMATSPPRFPRA